MMPILFFAAGLGTRMGDLVKDRPKPLVQVGQKTLIDHALSYADPGSFNPIVVNAHYKAPMLVEHLSNRKILISDETDELMETGGGLKKALPLLGRSTVATANTDAILRGPNPLKLLQAAWDETRMSALLLTVPREYAFGHTGQGDFLLDSDGKLARGAGEVYTGYQIIKTDRMTEMPDTPFSLNLYWDLLAKSGGLYGLSYPGKWCDVGRPTSIPVATELLASDV